MYNFWYDYINSKYGNKAKLCDRYRPFHCIHKNRLYIERHCRRCSNKFSSWSYKIRRPLHKRKNQKGIGVMKDELGGKIMKVCWITIKSLIAI